VAWFFISSYHDKVYMLKFEATIDCLSLQLIFIYLLTYFLSSFPQNLRWTKRWWNQLWSKTSTGKLIGSKQVRAHDYSRQLLHVSKSVQKSLLDFYFPELNATREKNGVYIPKERYSQEEGERKVIIYLTSVIMLTSKIIKQSLLPLLFS